MKPTIKLHSKTDAESIDSPELEESLSNSPGYHLDTLDDCELAELKEKYQAARDAETAALTELGAAHHAAEIMKPTHKAAQLRLRNRHLEEMAALKSTQIAELQVAETAVFKLRTAYMSAQKRQGELRRAINKAERELVRAEKNSQKHEKQSEKDLKFENEYGQKEIIGRLKLARSATKAHIKRLRLLAKRHSDIPLDEAYEHYVGYKKKTETPQQLVWRLIRHFQQKLITLDQDYVQATHGLGMIINEHLLFPREDRTGERFDEDFEKSSEEMEEEMAPKAVLKKIQLKTKPSEPEEDDQPEEEEDEDTEQALERRLASVKPKAVLSADSLHLVKP